MGLDIRNKGNQIWAYLWQDQKEKHPPDIEKRHLKRAWRNIRNNIKNLAKDSLGYYE
jgi:hypothetical protein